MKNAYYPIGAMLAISFVGISLAVIGFTQEKGSESTVSFAGESNKESFLLGEPVTFSFTFNNTGEKRVEVAAGGVDSGGLKIFIADKEGGEYKEYFVGSWGRKRGGYHKLEPGQSFNLSKVTVLWHGKPNVSHLNEDAARRLLAGKLTTEYAFQEPGVYFIKGRSYFRENATPIESAPIRIEIKQPQGDDLEVWNQIKGNKEIAFLLQNASFDTDKGEMKQQLAEQVEQIILQHPNGVYSGYLRPNLEKYKADEARRNDAYKNMKLGQKPE